VAFAIGRGARTNHRYTAGIADLIIAHTCGKQDVHHLERADLVALTVEAAAMANLPLARTQWIAGGD
jgi:methylamine---glutamate N-methyltransferase subunit C